MNSNAARGVGAAIQPRSDRAVIRIATTPGAEHLDDAVIEKLAALPRRLRRQKLAELRRAHAKDVKAARKKRAE